MAKLTDESIAKTFNIGSHQKMVKVNMELENEFYADDPNEAL
jgi:hypothetical protein